MSTVNNFQIIVCGLSHFHEQQSGNREELLKELQEKKWRNFGLERYRHATRCS